MEEDYVPYSPVMWADPLIPYTITMGAKRIAVSSMPAVQVDVGIVPTASSTVEWSELGLRMKELNKTEYRNSGVLWDLMPPPPTNPLCSLIKFCNPESIDEAAMVRLLLLQAITMKPAYQVRISDCPHLFAFNTRVKEGSCSVKWTPAAECSDNLQIGTQTATSTLYFRTLQEYAGIIDGFANENSYLRDENKKQISLSSVVFIPVKSCWRGQPWLLPYILAFTTTKWWNHAAVISVEMIDQMKFELMSRAATVCIPGNYERICLVVVDGSMTCQDYEVGHGIAAKHDGETEFAKKVMCYLGRTHDATANNNVATDVAMAINHMCKFMFTAKEFRKIQLRAAVLCTSRFCGYGVYPSRKSPSKAAGDDETERSRIAGVYKYNSQEDLMIGDSKLLDMATLDEQTLTLMLENRQHWRTDPLGYFAFSSVNISKDSAFHDGIHYPQYQLSFCTDITRVLKVCDVFKREQHKVRESRELFNTTIAYGSLLLGLTNWAAAELGVTLFEHNSMGNSHYVVAHKYFQLWPNFTQNFVTHSGCEGRVVDTVNHHKILGMAMNLTVWPKNITKSWYDTHYSWNCPWWYAAAIAQKFGKVFNIASNPNVEYKVDKDYLWGLQIHLDHSNPTDLTVLTQSCQYECKLINIVTPSASGGRARNLLSWSPNAYIDNKKNRNWCGSLHGICELNTVVFPRARNDHSQAFVDNLNPITPIICGGLRWPNVDADWLCKLQLPRSPTVNENISSLAENIGRL
ncbi:uncharacterized protein LOC132798321 [Drosophila nasuta]|uniref:uncharacterized protein LOC132798321 n=1 Tax=Drosophila nasuta TaxID=42062 RepID=UPI00295ED54D|nr:uncharacterized protein LOC132798321 [Drosophila nasuta]XP_060666118.1 uncharacterized protein LOC132798321 [Drosophila nasuta]